MLEGDEWKSPNGVVPTETNINFWFRQQNNLLMEFPNGSRGEQVIRKVVNNGEYFCIGGMFGIAWFRHDEVRILAVLPPFEKPTQKKGLGRTLDECNWFEFPEQK